MLPQVTLEFEKAGKERDLRGACPCRRLKAMRKPVEFSNDMIGGFMFLSHL